MPGVQHRGPPTVGVIANPVSGRDIRRVAARGGVSTSQDKRNRISRAVVGAVTAGAERVVVMDEPFRVASAAVADLRLDAEIEVLDIGARLDPADSVRAAVAMREMGVDVLIVLGGDGTNRTIAKAWPDVTVVPMSTGTNNVFPVMAEATIAGAAAGLVAAGRVASDAVARPSKVVHVVSSGRWERPDDLALIDAVHLENDFAGNRMPYEAESIRLLVLSRSEPTAMGVSAIGGLTCPCTADEEEGVVVRCGPGGRIVHAPIAPGLYRPVPVIESRRLALGEGITVTGSGVLAFDGDREHPLGDGESVELLVRRDGPRVIDVAATMRLAAEHELFMDDGARDTAPLMG